MKWLVLFTRILLAAWLIYGSYNEAGIFTAVSLGLIFLGFEVFGFIFRNINKVIDGVLTCLENKT